jgi:Resolvase, N terminal domain
MVMAWSVDRLGRSLQDLVGFVSELHALKIDLFLRQQGLDTTTPAGKAMFQNSGTRPRRTCAGQERGEASWSASDSPCAGETNP